MWNLSGSSVYFKDSLNPYFGVVNISAKCKHQVSLLPAISRSNRQIRPTCTSSHSPGDTAAITVCLYTKDIAVVLFCPLIRDNFIKYQNIIACTSWIQ